MPPFLPILAEPPRFSLPEMLLFIALVFTSAWLFWRRFGPILGKILQSKKDPDFHLFPIGKRVWDFVWEVLLQAKVIRERPLAGLAHALVFWSFCAFALVTLNHFAAGLGCGFLSPTSGFGRFYHECVLDESVETLAAGINHMAAFLVFRQDGKPHTLLLLAHLVAPGLPLSCQAPLFAGGALFMFIDDHGDCYADRQSHRVTYLNQVPHPAAELRRLVTATLRRLRAQLPASDGRALLCAFLRRYFVTRLQKHEEQRRAGGLSWAVYE